MHWRDSTFEARTNQCEGLFGSIAVMKENEVVGNGHIPFNISSLSMFLQGDFNKGVAEITGQYVNRDAGYGLEVQCIYRFYGPTNYIQRLQQN